MSPIALPAVIFTSIIFYTSCKCLKAPYNAKYHRLELRIRMKGIKTKSFGEIFTNRFTSWQAIGLIHKSHHQVTLNMTFRDGYGKLKMSPFYVFSEEEKRHIILFKEVGQIVSVPTCSCAKELDPLCMCYQMDQGVESLPRPRNKVKLANRNWNLLWSDSLTENYIDEDHKFAMIRTRVSNQVYSGPLLNVSIEFDWADRIYRLNSYLFYLRSSGIDQWKFLGFELAERRVIQNIETIFP